MFNLLTTAALFGNHMILQRDKLVPIWGAASPGAMVSVSYQGKDFSGLAGQDGRWKFDIGPFSTSWGEEMTISDGTETIRLADVACGEVWLAGGQSNMEFFMRYDTGCAVEKEGCAALPIRFFDFPEISYREQLKDADYSAEFGFWRLSAPEQLEWFSAVGYYFAKYLCQNLRIPVGVIGFNWGGTSILCWMSREAISHGKGEVFLEKYDASIRGLDLEKYQKSFRSNPHNFHNRMILSPELDQMLYGISHEEQEALMRTPPKGSRPQPMGPWDPMRPAGLYETMLLQIAPYGIRGFLWYLGKSTAFVPKPTVPFSPR